ncbi:MAG: hypothetical protein ACTHXB_02825, partial [Luteimonas sp.]
MTATPGQKPDFPQPNAIDPGQMRFIDNYQPLLRAGHYQVSVTQTLKASTAEDPAAVNVSQTRLQDFHVAGPRLALQAGEVHHRFPPANAQGVFKDALPQVVLAHRALPWERAIWTDAPEAPWMALVVLDADEIVPPDASSTVGTQTGTGATTIPATDLFAAAPEGVLLPALVPTPYQDPQKQVQVVDLTPEGFRTAVPTQDIVGWLASVREVDLGHKGLGGPLDTPAAQPEPGMPDWARWYSVVTAARFPAAPTHRSETRTQAVHLVSLEGFTHYLRSNDPAPLPDGITRVRMVSLCSWTFASLPEAGQDFAQLMAGLAPGSGESLAYRMPQKSPGDDVDAQAADLSSAAINAGYVPRGYQTRQGEATFAWYRGPFVPSLPPPLPALADSPRNSAQLAIYDPQTGLFDLSYATAFETGRLLALGNGAFTQGLMRWQRRGLRLVSLLAERALIAGIDLKTMLPDEMDALVRRPKTAPIVLEALAQSGLATLNDMFLRPRTTAAPVQQIEPDCPTLEQDTIADALGIEPVRIWLRRWARNTSGPVLTWLARLWLLEPVPYNTLVPDQALLPIESFRAFYVDRNWQKALLQGALSVGVASSYEKAFQQVLRQTLLKEAEKSALRRRNTLLDIVGVEAEAGVQMSGCLLRSAAVSGWPGLEIKAFHGGATKSPGAGQRVIDDDRTAPLPVAWLTQLGPQVMLGLFGGLADWMEIDEP